MTSRQPRSGTATSSTGSNSNGSQSRRVDSESPTSLEVPRPKRIACVVCRKRKLRCDGLRPSCATCSRLGHECAYDEVRRKSGPKRGYVKALEARLAQVETLLKDQNGSENPPPGRSTLHNLSTNSHSLFDSSDQMIDGIGIPKFGPESPNMSWAGNIDPSLSWEMVAMGMEESLPSIETMDALHTIYFEKIHPSIPIIHRGRYFASLDMAPNLRPSIALRYAMWTLAASVSEQYANMQTHYYHLSRKYLEDAEMKGHGEGVISMCTCQAWSLISTYEFKLMYFPRAWLSTGRATRLAQMMGLHRLDGQGLEVKQCLPAPKDWIEKEERRRTFWHIFCVDRYASMGTGWPMTIEERDILTNLPVTDDAFDRGRSSKGMSLKEAMTAEGAAMISPFGGVCLMASMFGRNLTHLHRPDADDKDDSLNGEFWRRHRQMDNILLNIALSLPSHFRLPAGINDCSIVFTNMNIHTSTICLHQAAIFKADKNRMPSTVSAESKIRCITAAAEIASIMRMVCHLDLSGMNPFISFCLYVAARVFVQYLKSRPGDEQVRASLQFLLTAMGHMKKKNPLTESFLVQLDVDLTGSIDNPEILKRFPYTQQKGQDHIPSDPKLGSKATQNPYQSPNLANDSGGSSETAYAPPLPPCINHYGDQPVEKTRRSPDTISVPENMATPPSQNQSSSNSSYSPSTYYNEYSGNMDTVGMGGVGVSQFQVPKELINWDMLGLSDPDYDASMTGIGDSMNMNPMGVMPHSINQDLSEFFAESTA